MSTDDQTYQVEDVVDKQVLANNVEIFRLRWTGYSSDDDTWQTEDDCLPDCYGFIKALEKTQFKQERVRNETPTVIRFRRVTNEFKLLLEWPTTGTRQYFYSSVIQSIDPNFLIDFYEQHITPIANLSDEWMHFLNNQRKNQRIHEKDKPRKIIAIASCGDERVCLVQWKQKQHEATIVEYSFLKLNYPKILIQFYEWHLIPISH